MVRSPAPQEGYRTRDSRHDWQDDRRSPITVTQGMVQASTVEWPVKGTTDLHTLSGVSAARWYEVKLAERASYRLIRVYDGRNGRCNLAEIQFWYLAPDTE